MSWPARAQLVLYEVRVFLRVGLSPGSLCARMCVRLRACVYIYVCEGVSACVCERVCGCVGACVRMDDWIYGLWYALRLRVYVR